MGQPTAQQQQQVIAHCTARQKTPAGCDSARPCSAAAGIGRLTAAALRARPVSAWQPLLPVL